MRQKALGLFVAVLAAVALVSASGAATTKAQKTTRIDVSNRAAVVHYLHSIHVKAKGAVIQRGLRNYAGARCPGKHWNCARTKHTVVQITGHGGKNRFACTRSHCVVVQISGVRHGVYVSGRQLAGKGGGGGGGNSGSCVKTGSGATTGTGQSCTIIQSGSGSNTAAIYENSMKVSGLTAAAAYTASITQTATGATSGNMACVLQSINLDGSTTGLKSKPVTSTLDAHQSLTIKQDVTGSGANNANQAAVLSGTTAICDPSSSSIAQSQTLTSTVNGTAAITQSQDATQILCPDGLGTDYANLCLDIEQNMGAGNGVASGLNNANFTQTNDLEAVANTPAGPVTQIQGNSDTNVGGLIGTINQNSSGVSTATATQNETECEDAATSGLDPASSGGCHTNDADASEAPSSLTQKQYGPAGVGNLQASGSGRIHFQKVTKGLGLATQTGNAADRYTINQQSTQNNDQGGGSTQLNTVQGDCKSDGNCVGNSGVTNNGGTTNNGNSGGGGGTVTYSTDCSTTCTAKANFPGGNVFVSVGNGQVQEWNPNASPAPALVRTFDTAKGAGVFTTGLAFDSNKNLYATDFNANDVTKFNSDGSLAGSFGSGYNADPESIAFDSSGNAYVGQADGSAQVLKFDPLGNPLAAFSPAIEDRGTDWIDLASDGCTLYYTSEGTTVKTFNVCTNTQGSDFATGLPGPGEAFAVKVLPGGGALVADNDSIVRLDGSGNVVQQYGAGESAGGDGWFSLALDPSGNSFWAGDLFTGDVKKFDLATGSVVASFNTGSTVAGGEAGGLAVAP